MCGHRLHQRIGRYAMGDNAEPNGAAATTIVSSRGASRFSSAGSARGG
jgi:hypothetical protein